MFCFGIGFWIGFWIGLVLVLVYLVFVGLRDWVGDGWVMWWWLCGWGGIVYFCRLGGLFCCVVFYWWMCGLLKSISLVLILLLIWWCLYCLLFRYWMRIVVLFVLCWLVESWCNRFVVFGWRCVLVVVVVFVLVCVVWYRLELVFWRLDVGLRYLRGWLWSGLVWNWNFYCVDYFKVLLVMNWRIGSVYGDGLWKMFVRCG